MTMQTPPRRVALFVTCLVDQFFPQVGESVVKVLRHLGVEVDFPPNQTCCGQPAFNSGFRREARAAARHFLDAFKDAPLIVAPSGSCASMVRVFYPSLFPDDPQRLSQARALASRTYEFSQFLVRVLGVTDIGARYANGLTVTYHDSCHSLRELGIRDEPRALLQAVKGVRFVEFAHHEVCCGFGGTFSVKYAPISSAILQDKLENIAHSGAQVLVATDSSCLMHMGGAMRRRGMQVRPMHIAQFLAEGLP
ncbi:MAG: (Fe-S)-binding protein [Dehalococcoidia bacterium]|nr:(Fe-S)-binding protein [Dehalococcoidia bacterium]MDW8120517.1 (Fe-S)-binding protein [Chloroflexota bacterium]